MPQITRHGLLLQQKAQAKPLDLMLLTVDISIAVYHLPGGFPVGSKQDAHRFTDRRFAQRAHIDHILMQLV